MSWLRRPARGTEATVHVPGVATMAATIVETVDGASEIALPRRRPVQARFLHRQHAVLIPQPAGSGGEVHGTLLAYEDDSGGLREDRMQLLHASRGRVAEPPQLRPADRSAIPLSALDEDLAEEMAEQGPGHYLLDDRPGTKRSGVRVQHVKPAAIIPDGFKMGWLNGATRNVSINGVLLAGAERLQEGDRLRLRFELAHEDDLIDVNGRVVRDRDPRGLRGVRIDRIAERERERLIRYIYEAQRRDLARRTRH